MGSAAGKLNNLMAVVFLFKFSDIINQGENKSSFDESLYFVKYYLCYVGSKRSK